MTRSGQRPVSGVLLLDKPRGLSSNGVLQRVKRLYRAAKAGHTGSLDPLAEGLLPICLGEATKLSGYLLNADKTYRFRCRLGVITRTGDAEGEVLERRPVAELQQARVEQVLAGFQGEIEQLPPLYSALKQGGRRLYQLARQGVTVDRQPRQVTIHRLHLLGMTQDALDCEVHCSKGTYVRSLTEDIGAALGCGAHVETLRRTAIDAFAGRPMVTLPELERLAADPAALDALLLPVDTAIASWPRIEVDASCAHSLSCGQPVWIGAAPGTGRVRLYQAATGFFGIGEILDDGRVALRRLVRAG